MNKIGACTKKIQQTLWPWVAMELTLLQFLQRLWSRKLIIGLLACKTKCFRGFQYNIRFYWSVQLVTTILIHLQCINVYDCFWRLCWVSNFFDLTLTFSSGKYTTIPSFLLLGSELIKTMRGKVWVQGWPYSSYGAMKLRRAYLFECNNFFVLVYCSVILQPTITLWSAL